MTEWTHAQIRDYQWRADLAVLLTVLRELLEDADRRSYQRRHPR